VRLRSAPGTQVWTKWNIKTNLVGLWKYPGNFRTLVASNIRQSTRQDGVSVTLLRCRPAFSGNRFHREISPAPGKLISVCRVASRPWIRNQNQIDRRLFAASPWSRTRLFVFVQRKTIERACIIAGTRRKESVISPNSPS
jgi:hypothetical protein